MIVVVFPSLQDHLSLCVVSVGVVALRSTHTDVVPYLLNHRLKRDVLDRVGKALLHLAGQVGVELVGQSAYPGEEVGLGVEVEVDELKPDVESLTVVVDQLGVSLVLVDQLLHPLLLVLLAQEDELLERQPQHLVHLHLQLRCLEVRLPLGILLLVVDPQSVGGMVGLVESQHLLPHLQRHEFLEVLLV